MNDLLDIFASEIKGNVIHDRKLMLQRRLINKIASIYRPVISIYLFILCIHDITLTPAIYEKDLQYVQIPEYE